MIASGCAFGPVAMTPPPPYAGTIFLDPDIITQADATAFESKHMFHHPSIP
jgi:hypothetical protein